MFDENVKTDVHLKVSSGEKPSNTLYWADNGTIGGDVVMPDNVTFIESYAFYKSNIKSINIPNSVTQIRDYAFNNCKSLKEVKIPDSVNKIYKSAFNSCEELERISLPKNGSLIFAGAPFQFCKTDNVELVNMDCSASGLFSGCTNLKTVYIPKDFICRMPIFDGCTNLENVTIEDGYNGSRLYFTNSTKYSVETIVSWFNALRDRTGDKSTSYRIAIGSENLNKLTDEQKNIALNKNWELV